MNSRTTKILGFSVPPAVLKEVEGMAKEEQRTKSELFREMVRVYKRYRDQQERDEERWITNIIAEAKIEQQKNPLSAAEMIREGDRFAQYGKKQAKKLGVKTKNVNNIIHEFRKSRSS